MRFRLLAADETVPGFGIYLTSSGKTVFAVQYKKDDKTVTKVIGKVSKMSLKKAHKRAAKLLSDPRVAHEREPSANPVQSQPTAEPTTSSRTVKPKRVRYAVKSSPTQGADRQSESSTTNDKTRQLQTKALEATNSTAVLRKLVTFDDLKETYSIPYGRRQIDRLEKAGKFPRRVPIGERRVGWVASEIEAHIEALLAKRSISLGKLGSSE